MEISISIDDDTLSEDELKKLMQCIREIEQNRPERHINIFIDSPEKTMEDVKAVISSIKPELPYVKIMEFGNEENKI